MTHPAQPRLSALPTVYTPAMVARPASLSPSAEKPALVVADLLAAGIPLAIEPPAPATLAQLARAHDPAYVEAVLACARDNGFGERSREVARSLPLTSGAMLTAARLALARGVAFAPCSGFHHAGFARGGGFCTFNGLLVAALGLLAEGAVRRVAILDCDMHWGDGTAEILRRQGERRVLHLTAGEHFSRRSQAPAFFGWLARALERCAEVDLVVYQAGADPHVDDPLGGLLCDEELARRDAQVFEALARAGVPVAWNLAGGYQRAPDGGIPKVLAIHRRTALACLAAFGVRR